jgi:hypothetical protein
LPNEDHGVTRATLHIQKPIIITPPLIFLHDLNNKNVVRNPISLKTSESIASRPMAECHYLEAFVRRSRCKLREKLKNGGHSTFGYGDQSASERQFSAFELVWCLEALFSFPFYFLVFQIFTVFQFFFSNSRREERNKKSKRLTTINHGFSLRLACTRLVSMVFGSSQ